MSKFCSNCGKEMEDKANVCSNCGTPFYNQANMNNNNVHIEKRDIATYIILSIVTCGIYAIYWFVCLTNDSNSVSNNEETTSGAMALLLTIVTCGIYSFYWNFKLGKKLYEAGKTYNVEISDNSLVYLLLSIFGLGIVSYCLAQSDLNKLVK